MARGLRTDVGGVVYHVINRGNGRMSLFHSDADYHYFEYLLKEMSETYQIRILAYELMPNHWHLLLYPRNDGDLSKAMHWITTAHATVYRSQSETIGYGHVYQGRYKSFVVGDDSYFLSVLKYTERNAMRAGLERRQWIGGGEAHIGDCAVRPKSEACLLTCPSICRAITRGG